jgi:hypothetical protein
MRRENERGRRSRLGWCGWILTLACVGGAGLVGNSAGAEENDEVSQATLEEAQAELDAAQAKLDAAQAKLDEATKTVPQGMREPTAEEQDDPVDPVDDSVDELEPVGPGFVSKDGATKKLQWALNKDGSRYFRIALWLQVWTRAMQLNPGTTVLDDPTTPELEGDQPSWIGDVGLRRARVLMFGEIFPRVFLLMHFGINNQTFRRDAGSGFKQSLFFHDAWAEFAAIKEHLYIGGGLLYWNGVSRMTNASTITLMSLDAPISNWPTIEQTDQFARQLGLYAKGKAGLFDYRVAVTRPFVPTTSVSTTGNFNSTANTWAFAGYFQLQFWDIESDVLPYTVGTYIGTKRVMNLGTGFYVQPRGIAYLDGAGNLRERSNSVASADFFVDVPLKGENAGAITAYGAYYWWDFGPNNLRNIGIMNVGDPGSGSSLAGRGNNYPMLGTGNSGYGQLGWLMPWKVNTLQFQPYILSQMSKFDALDDTMFQFGVGVNMFVQGHNAKVSLEYRNRPIYDLGGNVESRKGNALVLQMHLFI